MDLTTIWRVFIGFAIAFWVLVPTMIVLLYIAYRQGSRFPGTRTYQQWRRDRRRWLYIMPVGVVIVLATYGLSWDAYLLALGGIWLPIVATLYTLETLSKWTKEEQK